MGKAFFYNSSYTHIQQVMMLIDLAVHSWMCHVIVFTHLRLKDLQIIWSYISVQTLTQWRVKLPPAMSRPHVVVMATWGHVVKIQLLSWLFVVGWRIHGAQKTIEGEKKRRYGSLSSSRSASFFWNKKKHKLFSIFRGIRGTFGPNWIVIVNMSILVFDHYGIRAEICVD